MENQTISEEAQKTPSSIPLSLRGIASWHDVSGISERPCVRASIPALQRGLVWKPQQNELLWDSILRGFPIGALVISERIKSQIRASDRCKEEFTHHLLDGQQRCNAIALGFMDPFDGMQDPDSILWIDLSYKGDLQSTREYLIRLTTRAHPWGYKRNDKTGRLSAGEAKAALEQIEADPTHSDYERPGPAKLWPRDANTPIPLSWLLLNNSDAGTFWSTLKGKLHLLPSLDLQTQVHLFLEDNSPNALEERKHILEGIQRARSAIILALCTPSDLLEKSRQEASVIKEGENISNIEHLFQRLNQQGSRLEGEELAYSMIKAYWPELADRIDEVARHRMPESRMVSLGIRAALAQSKTDGLPVALGVSGIRALANNRDKRRESIYEYIDHHLLASCKRIDQWLRFDPQGNPSGLLPILITGIALQSPEIYLLLLSFADRLRAQNAPEEVYAYWTKPLQALVTVLHWFALDKGKVTNRIFCACSNAFTLENIQNALKISIHDSLLCPIHSPSDFKKFLNESFENLTDKEFQQWNWNRPLQGDGSEEGKSVLWKKWGHFLGVRGKRELLLYAQRKYLQRRFREYDPAKKELLREFRWVC